jgi:1,4-dihydroxy-2-naphthoyl-CoA hydrolase
VGSQSACGAEEGVRPLSSRLAMELPNLPVPPAESFDAQVGLRITEVTDEIARGEVPVRREIMQPWGLVHGGVYASVAESLASWATAMAVVPGGEIAMGMSNNTSFLRPARAGTIHAVARRRHRGRTTWVWDVDMVDDDDRLCATSRVTIAVRPLERGA